MPHYVIFTVYKSQNLDLAIAESVLSELGLKTVQLKREFVASYGYPDLLAFFKERVNSPDNAKAYTNIARALKEGTKVTVSFGVANELANDVKQFLAIRENKLSDRYKDGKKQMNSTIADVNRGVKKNSDEALNDLDKGAGRTAHGLWNSMTAPAESQTVHEGLKDVRDGLYQFGSGIFKAGIQTPLDEFLTLIGGEIDRDQTLIGLENIGRSLNTVEKEILQSVFGFSILLELIIIKEGNAGVYGIGMDRDGQNNTTYFHNNRALTRGNTIYMKNNVVGSQPWNSTLVHETTHVWQNQNGGTDYMSEALYAQVFGDGYDYQKGISQGKAWAMLNPEQQAKLVQDAYDFGYFKGKQWNDPNNPSQVERNKLIKYFDNVVPQLRNGQGAT